MRRIRSNFFIKLRLVILIFFLIAIFSCSNLKRYERFSGVSYKIKPKPDEIYLSPSLKKWLEKKPYCPMFFSQIISQQHIVSKENDYYDNYLYSAIINKLSKSGLIKDGEIDTEETLIDDNYCRYSFDTVIKLPSDLIIDFIDFKSIKYHTNKVITDTIKQEATFRKTFYYRGQSLKFRITHILTGEVAGNFVLNYTPCINGCTLIYNKDDFGKNDLYFRRQNKKLDSKIDEDEKYKIFEELLNRFISELLKYRDYPESHKIHRNYIESNKMDSLEHQNLNYENVKFGYQSGDSNIKFESHKVLKIDDLY